MPRCVVRPTHSPHVRVQWVAALVVQRAMRGFFGRLVYRRKILKRSEDIFMQVFLAHQRDHTCSVEGLPESVSLCLGLCAFHLCLLVQLIDLLIVWPMTVTM